MTEQYPLLCAGCESVALTTDPRLRGRHLASCDRCIARPSGPWTRHGHEIPGITVAGPGRPPVARCGGPAICSSCAHDAEQIRLADISRRVGEPLGVASLDAILARHNQALPTTGWVSPPWPEVPTRVTITVDVSAWSLDNAKEWAVGHLSYLADAQGAFDDPCVTITAKVIASPSATTDGA